MLGYAGLPLVPVPHPLAGNLEDLVAAKAWGIVDEVVRVLTGDASALAAEQRTRFTRLTQRRIEGGAVCTDDVCAIDLSLTWRKS